MATKPDKDLAHRDGLAVKPHSQIDSYLRDLGEDELDKSAAIHRDVPIDMIFSGRSPIDASSRKGDEFDKYSLAPLVNITPYMRAIEDILSGNKVIDEYHEFEGSRYQSNRYDRKLGERIARRKLGPLGRNFWRTIPIVDEISQDRLLVHTGLFDACVLKRRNREWIKVHMPAHVANQWDARSSELLKSVCKKQNRTQIYTPVMHPDFRNYNFSRRGSKRLDMIRQHLGPAVEGMSLLDIGCNSGYYTYHFRRQGMDVTGLDIDADHLAIAQAQAAIYNVDVDLQNVSLKDWPTERRYDVVIAMSVFWHMLGWGSFKATISEDELKVKLRHIVGKYLYWESGPEPSREIDLIRKGTQLTEFEQLGTTSATGIDDRVFGVFYSPA